MFLGFAGGAFKLDEQVLLATQGVAASLPADERQRADHNERGHQDGVERNRGSGDLIADPARRRHAHHAEYGCRASGDLGDRQSARVRQPRVLDEGQRRNRFGDEEQQPGRSKPDDAHRERDEDRAAQDARHALTSRRARSATA